MFDISWTEFLLIGVVALIVIGPKELPGVLRTLGQWTRKVRSMAADFQNQFQEAMREAEMADLKKQVDDMAQDFKNFDPLKDVRDDVEAIGKDIERSLEAHAGAEGGRAGRRCAAPAVAGRCTRRRACQPRLPSPVASGGTSRAGACRRRKRRRPSPPQNAARAGQHRAHGMSREDEDKEIEATKAPLMEHLIELRSRLIKALAAFALALIVLLLLRQAHLQRADLALRLGGRRRRIRSSSIPGCSNISSCSSSSPCSARPSSAFPVVATQIYMFVAPGLYRNERQAFLPYLVATPIFFLLGSMVVYFVVWPMLARFSLSMQQIGRPGRRRRSSCCRRSRTICR